MYRFEGSYIFFNVVLSLIIDILQESGLSIRDAVTRKLDLLNREKKKYLRYCGNPTPSWELPP